MAGELRHDAGAIMLGGIEIGALPAWARVRCGLARTFQIAQLLPHYSVLDNVALAIAGHSRAIAFAFLPTRAGIARRAIRRCRIWRRSGCRRGRRPVVSDLGHGECKQLDLAVALATRPSLLLLDEPMAGLSALESRKMTELLATLKGRLTMVLVEHDMDAVFALADRISVLVYGRVIATGNSEEIKADEAVRVAYLGEDDGRC